MANEAILIFETSSAIPMTVDNTGGIEKGAVLKLTDLMTASGSTVINGEVAGIAASEKISGDGKTKLGVYRGGIFKVSLSGSCTVGDPLLMAGSNKVHSDIATGVSGSIILGSALETGTDGETILMELRPQDNGGGAQ